MALMRKRYQRTDRLKNIFTDATSGGHIVLDVLDNKFLNLRDIPCRQRMKLKSRCVHLGKRCLRNSSSRCRKLSKNASPSIGFTSPLLRSS